MEPFTNDFFEFAALLGISALVGYVGRLFRQPLIVSFIAVGILVGPYGLDLLTSSDKVHLLAELGIALLLFVVGLKLDVNLIRNMGKVALLTGLGQVLFTTVFGYLIAIAFGMSPVTALYVAVALTFSSTIIIVKLLSDKKEIQTLHGQISIGFLIVQDVVVILVMIFLSAFGNPEAEELHVEILMILLKGFGLLALTAFFMRWVLPWLMHSLAKSQELLLLFAMAWAVTLAALSNFLGFSNEVGAFLGGLSIASTPYKEVISGRLVSVRDFLLLFFFINLGSNLNISLLGDQLFPALTFSFFVLIGNPVIVMIIMGLMGYRKRTSFLAGLTVAQISEFSLILAALGLTLGQINEDTVGLITLVGLITISLSTYLINYSHQIYEKVSPMLSIFEKKVPYREDVHEKVEKEHFDVVIFGLGTYGRNIAHSLESKGYKVFGVDHDPAAVKHWAKRGKAAMYGDADDPDLPQRLPHNTTCVISTLPDKEINLALIKYLRLDDSKVKVAVTSYTGRTAKELELAGADLILLPFRDAADNIADKFVSLPPRS